MQMKFKRHDKVVLLTDPDPEYIEYHNEDEDDSKDVPIKKGMSGIINMFLSNGKYHVQIVDKKGNTIAYVPMGEEELGKA